MRHSSDGTVPVKTPWRMQLDPNATVCTVSLRYAAFEVNSEDTRNTAELSFEWRPTIGALFAQMRSARNR